jgi:hypothetical protein
MSRPFASALFGVAVLATSAALAQGPSATVAPVTVKAAPTSKAIEKQATRFVQTYAAAANPNVDQIGRWRGPVCVRVWGLPRADQAAKIKARIDGMAQAVGLPAARAGCKTNVEIVFSDQAQSMMDMIARRWEPLLGFYHLSNSRRLKTINHPIQAWYVTGTASQGVDFAAVMFSGLPLSLLPQSTDVVDDPQNTPPVGCFDRFTSCYKSAFHNVLIMADSKALEGRTLSLVADDMVMLALTEAKSLDGCNALPSVIDAFAKSPCQGRDPPDGLTPADAAYLTALYSADLGGKKRFEQSDIAERMAAVLIKASADAKAR